MPSITVFVGIDPSADSFAAALLTLPSEPVVVQPSLDNSGDGFAALCHWLAAHEAPPEQTMICIEDTGVYCEHLCYYLHHHGYQVAVHDPGKIAAAIPALRKNDLLDAQRIAEYAYRYRDALQPWQPNDTVVEQVDVLLATRELLSGQMTANRNALKSVERKYVDTPKARLIYQQTITHLKQQIASIDQELKQLIQKHSQFGPMLLLLTSVPGVGLLLSANLLVLSHGFNRRLEYRELASYIGICPHQKTSGSSVRRRARSAGYGHSRLRKLLYLASLSLRRNNTQFCGYFLRKVAEGKSKRLVLNNIANRLLRILCAVVKTRTPFIASYRSVDPKLLHAS